MLTYVCNLKLKTICFIVILSSIFYLIFQVLILFIKPHSSIPVLIWWTPFMPSGYRTISCVNEEYKCLITNNRSHDSSINIKAYLFYGSHIKNYDFPLPRNSSNVWAVFHEESPKNYAPFLFNETQNLFNISATFSRQSDIPVTLQYLADLDLLTDTKYYIPVHFKNYYLDEISPVLYIQSDCDTPINRDYLVKELGRYIRIDSYGKCLRNKTFPKILTNLDALDLYHDELLKFVSKYKFTIAFENSICDDYITEKLWRPLIAGSIPIYFGSPTIKDWLPNDNSAILVKDFEHMRDLGEYIRNVNENDSLYETFLEHKIKSKITNNLLTKYILNDHPISVFECLVCEQAYKQKYFNSNNRQNIYDCPKPMKVANTWNQHWDIGKCQAKALKLLISRNRPYSATLFEETWKKLLHTNNC